MSFVTEREGDASVSEKAVISFASRTLGITWRGVCVCVRQGAIR